MARPKIISGTKFLKFRVSDWTYNFLMDCAKRANLTISEFCRRIIEYQLLSIALSDNPKKLSELKEEFKKRFNIC
jgi:hypothetical protein